MRMQLSWVLVLAVVTSFSGCCCPMTCAPMCCSNSCCSNPCWLEQLRENCDDTAAAIEDQAYRMNHAVACKFQQLSSSQDSTQLCDDCANNVGPESRNCQDQTCENYTQPAAPDAHSKAKGLRQQRDPAPVMVKTKRCKRCRQVPCRCGYCEGCDGFERADQPYSPATNPINANCAVPGNNGNSNSNFQALPEPPDEMPPPAPAAGPTPIRPPPPPKPTPLQNNPSTSIQPQPLPVTLSETFEEGPKLEPVDFEELEQPQKRQGWQPVKGSKPSR